MYSIKGRTQFLFIASLFLSGALYAQQGKNFRFNFNDNLKGPGIVTEERKIIIKYLLTDLNISELKNNQGDFYRVTIPGHISTSDPGKPELPVLSRIITIPENGRFEIRINNVKSHKINIEKSGAKGILFPKQVDETKVLQKQRAGFVIDKTTYSKKGLINSDTVRIEYLGKVRNRLMATVFVTPVRYNPWMNELEVITSMDIEIDFPEASVKSSSGLQNESALFTETLGKGVLNYNPDEVITGYSDKPVKMIILTDTAFRKHLKPFIQWKTQKGFRITTLYRGKGLAGSTFSEIKDTLTRLYNSATEDDPAPEYLLIVGNINRIPKSDGTSQISDLYYGEFDGAGDYLPDVFIGRLPVADTVELKGVVKKLIQYEKFQFADTNKFYNRSMVIAGNDEGYKTYMNGQVTYATSNYLNPDNNIEPHAFYYPQSATAEDSIKTLINSGVSFINYTGHGDESGWLDPVIKVPDIALFNNKNMYPFVISNACRTAHYDITPSMGNKMIVSADKGAIGFIGCSNDSYWDEDFYWAVGTGTPNEDPKYSETGLGAYDRLFHNHNEKASDWYITMGQVNYAGNLAVSSSTSLKKKYYWETYTLLGDPSVIPYTGTPEPFNVSIPDTLPNGIKSLSLTVEPFSYIAVSHWDTLWDASFASPTGSVVLDLPGRSDDSCLVVITGQNRIPLIKRIRFANINKEFINLTTSAVNDAGSNNNGLADYGESFFLKLTISNLGLADATKLSAKISTTSDWVTLTTDSVYIGTLAGRSEIILPDNISMKISDLVPDKGFITLFLKLQDSATIKNYIIDICIHAPVLDILNCTIDDTGSGNGNYIAEPGETIQLIFDVYNSGSSDISGTFNITNIPSGVSITDPDISTGILQSGESKLIPITISLSPSIQNGSIFDLSTYLDCTPYIVSKSFSIPVGKVRESFEYQSFTIFPWQNSGDHPWIITDNQVFEGHYSARSAVISHNTESVLILTINNPVDDTLRFHYKVSSEQNYDFLIFKLNGTVVFQISGETDWKEKKVLLPAGINHLEWIYKKDESVSSGNDCAWIDYISFPPLAFNKVDLKTGKILTPQPGKDYNLETISAEIINLGADTIQSFNAAYRINQLIPVTEHFGRQIVPGDTINLIFTTKADLSANGTYLIKVFGYSNNDGYLENDTSTLVIINTGITPVENPDNNVTIMPNPFTTGFQVVLNSGTDDEVVLSIFNQTGKLMWSEKLFILPGKNVFAVTPESLAPGFYTLFIKGNSIVKAIKLIKTQNL